MGVLTFACFGSVVAAAFSARPVGGGKYFALPAGAKPESRQGGVAPVAAELRVSRRASSFAPAAMTHDCVNGESVEVRVHGDSGRSSPVAVDRRGRFTAAGRSGSVRFRLNGRFVTRDRARIVYTLLAPPSTRASECQGRLGGALVLFRNGRPPFSGCRSQRAVNLFRSSTARVFQQYKLLGTTAFVTHAYACRLANPARRFHLGENLVPDSKFESFREVGPLLGFIRRSCAMCVVDSGSIEVRDLRDGSIVKKAPKRWAGTDPPFGALLGYPAYYRVQRYVLEENGSLAWTLARYSLTSAALLPRRKVWARDTHGQRLLDVGPDIDLQSLTLTGSALSWTNAGSTRTATLDTD